jgi:DNA-directed RNA polymerase specialized sigma24 family protein
MLARVYAAAVAASGDVRAAEDATVRAFETTATDPERLAATAVRLALRASPAPAFAGMSTPDAEAVALCRLLSLDVQRVATILGVAVPEIKRRLIRGLRAALPDPVDSA